MTYEFSPIGITHDDKLASYVRFKMHELGKQIPRSLRRDATAVVRLAHKQYKDGASSRCTIELVFAREAFRAVESTIHPYAALDIVCLELTQQLKQYRKNHKRGLK